jgi:hypothetical protein
MIDHLTVDDMVEYLKKAAYDAGRDNMGMSDPYFQYIADYLSRLDKNLETRDKFIVNKGLWQEFVNGLGTEN